MTPAMIYKILSPNDVGETGTHQAGILIPKDSGILSFFPVLRKSVKNPRERIVFEDRAGQYWQFNFIYYNNRFFGGTRDEYRLTGMTRYIQEAGLSSGDEIIFHRDSQGNYSLEHRFAGDASVVSEAKPGTLRLTGAWRVVNL